MKRNTQTRPLSGVSSIKKAGNNIIANKTEKPGLNTFLVRDIQTTPGNGLWCINTEKKKENLILPSLETGLLTQDPNKGSQLATNPNNPNLELEQKMEKRIISQLKYQIQDLTQKLQNALTQSAEAEYRANRSENNKQNYLDLCEKKAEEARELEDKIDSLENTVINLNEALANTRKEILRLQNENNVEQDKAKKYYEMYQSLIIERERRESVLNSEIHSLGNKIQFLNTEKENLIKMIRTQANDKSNEFINTAQKIADDKENQIKMNEITINKLLMENSELKRKLTQEEQTKGKLMEVVKKKKEKINRYKDELVGYKNAMTTYTNEVKWNQDLVMQRENQIKVQKDKIKKLEEQITKQTKMMEKYKKSKVIQNQNISNINENKENVQELILQNPVKAKPFLFGPESNN
jgi:chromosome segregation ATPase